MLLYWWVSFSRVLIDMVSQVIGQIYSMIFLKPNVIKHVWTFFCTKWNLEVLINGNENELLKCPFIFRQCLSRTILSIACMGAWIAEWSSHSTLNIGTLRPEFEPRWHQILFRSQAQHSWFYLICLIRYYYLSVKFVMWIVKQKIENKRNLF